MGGAIPPENLPPKGGATGAPGLVSCAAKKRKVTVEGSDEKCDDKLSDRQARLYKTDVDHITRVLVNKVLQTAFSLIRSDHCLSVVLAILVTIITADRFGRCAFRSQPGSGSEAVSGSDLNFLHDSHPDSNPYPDSDLDWVRNPYSNHQVLVLVRRCLAFSAALISCCLAL